MNKDIRAIQQMRENGRFAVDQPFTPDNLVQEITAQISANTASAVLVLFTIEWALYLKELGYTNITVGADDPIIENICKKRGLRYIGINDLENNKNMKFDVVVGNPPYNRSAGGASGTGGDNKLYRKFVDVAIARATRFVAFVTPKGVFSQFKQLGITPTVLGLMDNNVWKYDTCYFVIDKLTTSDTTIVAHTLIKKLFTIKDTFDIKFYNGEPRPVPKKYIGHPTVYGIVEHKSIAHPDPIFGEISERVADYGPKFISNGYGREASWLVTEEPTCVGGFTIKFDTVQDAQRFKLFVTNNKALEYFRQKMNEHKGVVKVTRYLKRFDLSQIVTGFEYPVEWHLTQAEIDLIESTVK